MQKTQHITVQADRTATVNAALKVGQTSTTIEVDATPLMNATYTTNGYVMEKDQIDEIPLATGSFTGLAILSPGLNAELPGGTGVNSGMGNASIWANGQRDTSNAFLINGVDASNFFNGKSTSQVESQRVVNNTGGPASSGTTSAGVEQSSVSVYLSIGNAIPTPAPETLQEVRVNSSMYDAQQGSASGAHIDMSTSSGGNALHGGYTGVAAQTGSTPPRSSSKTTVASPRPTGTPNYIVTPREALWAARSSRTSSSTSSRTSTCIFPSETGDTLLAVPPGLSDSNRDAAGLAGLTTANWSGTDAESGFSVSSSDWENNPVGLALFRPSFPMASGSFPTTMGTFPINSRPQTPSRAARRTSPPIRP